ncbi:MAG TPA: AIM24 family protein [Thermoleophilia bacterium]|nr:AIM24 family protein [Thermoleophilia bacterium]
MSDAPRRDPSSRRLQGPTLPLRSTTEPRVGGLKSLFLSGEGFVVSLTGPGTFFMQTRSAAAFVQWLAPLLPRNNN